MIRIEIRSVRKKKSVFASSLRGLGSSGMHSVRMSDTSPFSTVAYTILRLLFESTRPSASSASAAIHRSPRRMFVSLERINPTSPYPDSRPASLAKFRLTQKSARFRSSTDAFPFQRHCRTSPWNGVVASGCVVTCVFSAGVGPRREP